MANNENLRPCKPGETHNPKGKPKGRKSISTYLKMFVEGNVENLPNGELKDLLIANGFDCVAAAMAHKKTLIALKDEIKPDTQLKAMDSIEDRLEGKATQKTELTGKDGASLNPLDVTDYEMSLKDLTMEELKEHNEALAKANELLRRARERKEEMDIEDVGEEAEEI